jgi:uncharacterized protein (DUF433 family)
MSLGDLSHIWRKVGIKSGRPCIRNTGILVEIVVERFVTGETITFIAEDFSIPPEAIEHAIRLTLYARGIFLDTQPAMAKVERVVQVEP